jgi:hypothetical protein
MEAGKKLPDSVFLTTARPGRANMKRAGYLFISLFFQLSLSAQITQLTGVVSDSLTGERLAFVTILVNGSPTEGTSTDTNGEFVIRKSKPITSLQFSFVGYHPKVVTFSATEKISSINVLMSGQQTELEDVTVIAGENPAHRIIKAAVNNRDRNNYTQLNSYQYQAYVKLTVSGFPPDTIYSDSLRVKFFRFLDDNHLLVMESMVERKYLRPDLVKEKVTAQKVSGLNNPNFTILTSQLQTTNFYSPFIEIATTAFVNPVSPNSWEKYFFTIEDTLYRSSDTTFVISYRPAKGKKFASLLGILEINSRGYAIERVTAKPADTIQATLFAGIEQRYSLVDDAYWFPSYLESNIGFRNFVWEGMRMEAGSKTFITNPVINPPISKKEFDGVSVDLLDDLVKDDAFWSRNRLDTLTVKEQRTYYVLDSLNRKHHFDRKLAWANAWQDGLLRFPYVSVQIYNSIKFNKPEFMRIGLGLETNRDFSKRYVISGFAAYGLRDELWKYGGSLKWKIYEPKNITLKFSSAINYEENGGLSFFQGSYLGSGIGVRNYTITVFDYVDRQELSFTARVRKAVNMQLTGFTALKKITNDYRFLDDSGEEPKQLDQFRFSGVQVALRWSDKEKVVESLDHYYWVNTGHPVFWLQVTQGFKGFLQSDFTYTKYEAQVGHAFNTKSLGITSFMVNTGFVMGKLPSSELYAGRSSYAPVGLFAPGSFQTMRSGEFMSDRFVALYFKQDFLYNVIRWGNFRPNFQLITNAAWGKLLHPELHLNAGFRSMDQGYFESGVVMNSLLARKFFGIVRLGLGMGIFYRYGPYAFANEWDNLSFKITMSYNLK